MPRPLAQLYEEHSSLAAVLHAMSALVREVRERGKYIDHFGTFTPSLDSLLLARRAEVDPPHWRLHINLIRPIRRNNVSECTGLINRSRAT